MDANSLPKVLRDALGCLPGDPIRGARLKTLLQTAVLDLWKTGQAAEFTDEEIEVAISELVDEEFVRRLAQEFDQFPPCSDIGNNHTRRLGQGLGGRPKDQNRA